MLSTANLHPYIAAAVEQQMGSAQDIEGAIVGEEIVLLQSRAQV